MSRPRAFRSLRLTPALALMLATHCIAELSWAEAPEVVRFQGTVSSLGGAPVEDGEYQVQADLYDGADPGAELLYSQTLSVPIEGGAYTLVLSPPQGEEGTLMSAFSADTVFLELTVLSGPNGAIGEPLLPRQVIASAPYALRAGSAESVPEEPLEPWQAASLQNGWQNYGGNWAPASFYKGPEGIVRLRGLVEKGSQPASHEPLFTLPEGYRPEFKRTFLLLACCGQSQEADHAAGRIDVLPSGRVEWVAGNPTFLDLGSVEFRAASP